MGLKYERKLIKAEILELDPKLNKKIPELTEVESDVDEDFIKRHLEMLEVKETEKLAKQLAKENERRKAEGEPLLIEIEWPPKKPKKVLSIEKLEAKLDSLTARISAQKLILVDKDEGKQTALGTSKINYIDPRISAAWCDKYSVPLEKIFNKTLREKFKWAMDADKDFVCFVNVGLLISVIMKSNSDPI